MVGHKRGVGGKKGSPAQRLNFKLFLANLLNFNLLKYDYEYEGGDIIIKDLKYKKVSKF